MVRPKVVSDVLEELDVGAVIVVLSLHTALIMFLSIEHHGAECRHQSGNVALLPGPRKWARGEGVGQRLGSRQRESGRAGTNLQ